MTTQMFKYTLSLREPVNQFDMPDGAELRHVATQDGRICMWAQVDPDQRPRQRFFTVVGTGKNIPEQTRYVGTAQLPPYVWHVFEVLP